MEPKRAKTLTPSRTRHLLRVTDATSRHPERDTLVLLFGFMRHARITSSSADGEYRTCAKPEIR